jgi:hypothetical protein
LSDYFAGQIIHLERVKVQSLALDAGLKTVLGHLYQPNASGNMVPFDGLDTGKGVWQAAENKDNTVGLAGAISAQFIDCMVSDYVLNIATGLVPGSEIKWDAINFRGIATVLATDDRTRLTIGRFNRQPGAKIATITAANDELAIITGGI